MYYANTLKTAVACALLGAGAFTASVSGAHAQPKFDAKLAKFLADKAAAELGDLRDGFAIKQAPDIAPGGKNERDSSPSVRIDWPHDGIDRTTTSSIEPAAWVMPRTDIRVVYPG